MKGFTVLFFFIALLVFGQKVQAQSENGELTRFDNESLSMKNKIKLYPNPSVDFLEIKIDNSSLENVSLSVHNIIGNAMKVEVEMITSDQFRVKVEDLPPGYYLISIKDEQEVFRETYKFLKK